MAADGEDSTKSVTFSGQAIALSLRPFLGTEERICKPASVSILGKRQFKNKSSNCKIESFISRMCGWDLKWLRSMATHIIRSGKSFSLSSAAASGMIHSD